VQPATHRQQSTTISLSRSFKHSLNSFIRDNCQTTVHNQVKARHLIVLEPLLYAAKFIRKSAGLVPSGLQQENLVQANILARYWLDLLVDGPLQL
jgi:hypothetical protein